MKIKVLLLSLAAIIAAGNVLAQQVESDDMYFNSKDRVKLRASQKASEVAYASVKKERKSDADEEGLNPTDSYSARNVNPEYTSRSQSQVAKADDEDYYVSNYQFNNRNNYDSWNNNYNNWLGSSWYRPGYWGSSMYGWNNPYYGYYDSWNSPWYDPYWNNNGWSSSIGFYYGNSWNYGWGGNYASYWGPRYGWGSNWYGGNNIIIINNGEGGGRTVSHGKRPTRGSYVVSDQGNNSRTRSSSVGTPDRGAASGGRVSTRPPEYYNRSWRSAGTTTSQPSNSYDSRSNTQLNRSNSWNSGNSSNSSWERSSSPSPSRTFDSGTRSHSSSPSQSSSGSSTGRTRGRD